MIAIKGEIPSFQNTYDDDPDTQSLLEDEEFNQNKNEVFLYLEAVRESGKINMFEAATFIQEEFECSKSMSKRYLSSWMKSYKGGNNDND